MQMRKRLQASPRREGYAGLRSKPSRRRRDGRDMLDCGASQAGVAETGGICKGAEHHCRRRREEGGRKYTKGEKTLSPDSVGSSPAGRALKRRNLAFYIDKDGTAGGETPPLRCNARLCRQ